MLETAQLHAETVDGGPTRFFLALDGETVIGVAGFEFYGDDALLRSVAVTPELRGLGVGGLLVDWMIGRARAVNTQRIFLLTQTAERFFAGKGFRLTGRNGTGNVPLEHSTEFGSGCPSSAVCMMLALR